jgi:predicted PurR-regulated permease PerM
LAVRLPDLLNKVQLPAAPAALPEAQGAEDTIVTAVRNEVANHSRQFLALLPGAALNVISRARSLIFVVLIPILSFFFLKDGSEIVDSLLALISFSRYRETAERIAADLHVLLAQYIRALVLLGAVAALAYGVFLSIMGVQYAILVAVVAFPLEFIPLVGPLTGASIVVLVAGLTGSGHHLVAILVFLVAFRLFQDYVVSPHLLSSGMKLHPLMVIFGVLAGGSIAGVAGSFLSVPVLATLRIVYRQLLSQPSTIIAPAGIIPPSPESPLANDRA